MISFLSRLRFCRDNCGTVAVIFSLSIFVVIGAVGLSVDGARVYAAQQRLQAAVDAAVLAAARRAANDGDTMEVQAIFAKFLNASSASRDIALRTTAPDLSQPRKVSAEIVGDMKTLLMPILGFDTVEVRASASAEFGFTKLEVALALDNTGSMSGTKLDALKSSATNLVDTLLDRARNDGDIKLALVPFSQYVNVGMEHRGASWITVPNDYSEATESCGDYRPVISSTNCREVTYTYTSDGVPHTGTYQECDNVYGDPVYRCTTSTRSYTWYGCVGSRNSPLNTQDGSYSTRIPGLLNASCASKIQPLTSDRSALRAAVDGMVATGNTYLPGGIMWGLRALSPSAPFAESGGGATDADGNRLKKFLILMTDGANTTSPTYPEHDGSDATLANTLTTQSCDAVKAQNVGVFTIAFDVTDTTLKDLLRGCATTPGRYFDAADATQLEAAMQAISEQLGGLRLTN